MVLLGGWIRDEDGNGPPAGSTALAWLMVLFVVAWWLSFLPFFIASLYRVPVIPFLLLGCALLVTGCVRLARQGRVPAAAVWLAAFVGVVGASEALSPDVDPGFGKRHVIRAVAWLSLGDVTKAEAEYREALRLNPSSAVAHAGVGAALLEQERFSEAAHHLRTAATGQPSNAVAHFNLGLALARLGTWREADQAFATVVALEPGFTEAWVNRGIAAEVLKRLDGAVENYERALTLDPNHRRALNNLAWIYATSEGRRNPARAVELAEKLSRPDLNELDTLAAAYAAAGRFGEAVATMEKAIAMTGDPESAQARALRKHLDAFGSGRSLSYGG
jgi:tetratricopeptide (TPR) repeat protein